MKIDFSQLPLITRAFSEKPMTFCDNENKKILSSIVDLIAVETGDRKAREYWQAAQLRNLLVHAAQRSAFWRQRIGTKKNLADIKLSSLPILARADVKTQVETEGALLLPSDRMPVHKHATSGSSGMPVEFYISDMCGFYNTMRGLAQHFIDGRDPSRNIVRLKAGLVSDECGFTVKRPSSWNKLGGFVKSGNLKHIKYANPDIELLCKELQRDPIGHMIAQTRILETILQKVEPRFLKEAGAETWICVGESPNPEIRELLSSVYITVTANYSSEEVGMIAHECREVPGYYHVATSNVIVEVDTSDGAAFNNTPAGRVLVTHLHSYATPFIRYDIGDMACLKDSCPCGHDGPVLFNIYGRSKQLLKHADGHLSPFLIPGTDFVKVAKFSEYRMRQTDLTTIVAEIASQELLPEQTIMDLKNLIKANAGDDFEIKVENVRTIDWGGDMKRLGFRNELL